MRTTKVQAAQVMYTLLERLHEHIGGEWSEVGDGLLEAMIWTRAVAQEFQSGDPRGRKSIAARQPGSKFVGGEQELFRA